MKDKILRCAVYIRVSTSEQAMHGKSLQAQQEYLEKYAADHNMNVIGVYADKGQTARKELKKRKAIHDLLRDVERDKLDVILFWKMDRWFRNVSDFYKVQDILDAHNVRWIAVAEPQMNMETRDGRLNLNIMLSIGQNEVDTTSERIKFTVNNMIDNGRLVWGENNVGFGYKIIDGRMVKDPDTEHMVNAFYQHILLHKCKSAAVKYMRDTFHIDFTYSQLRTMMSSEFYIGKYRDNDHYCPAYLSPAQWSEIQSINTKNIRKASSGRIYYFSGMIRCPECGVLLAGCGCQSIINRKTKEKRTYCYYRCNNCAMNHKCSYSHKLSQNLLENYLLQNLTEEYNRFLARSEAVRAAEKPKARKRSRSSINAEISRLNLMFQKGRIEFEYYNEEYERLEAELKALSEEQGSQNRDYSHVAQMLDSNFQDTYRRLTDANKQVFWQQLIESIDIDGKEVRGVNFRGYVSD